MLSTHRRAHSYRWQISAGLAATVGASVLCLMIPSRVQAIVLDGTYPQTDASIQAMVVQSDGKVIIGGGFMFVFSPDGSWIERRGLARINPDGTVDPDFDPHLSGPVYALALQPDGKILVGGDFSGSNSAGGQDRDYVARLEPLKGRADSFNPKPNRPVEAMVVLPNGRIVLGGDFNYLSPNGGPSINRDFIAQVSATGNVTERFDPHLTGRVLALALDHSGKILVGGFFDYANGKSRQNLARLDAMTGQADSFAPQANSWVDAIAVQPDGKILVGGNFAASSGFSIGAQARNHIARLDPVTGLADSFDPNANGWVTSIAVQSDGKILVGGFFSGGNGIGGQARAGAARLDPVTGLADSFDPNLYPPRITAVAEEPGGNILIAGAFDQTAPDKGGSIVRRSIARFAEPKASVPNDIFASSAETELSFGDR